MAAPCADGYMLVPSKGISANDIDAALQVMGVGSALREIVRGRLVRLRSTPIECGAAPRGALLKLPFPDGAPGRMVGAGIAAGSRWFNR